MNKHIAIEDFGYRDFILIKASHGDVLAALKDVALENDAMMDFEAQPWKPGLLMRLLFKVTGLGKEVERGVEQSKAEAEEFNASHTETEPFTLHYGEAAKARRITQPVAKFGLDAVFDPYIEDMRLSSIDESSWVLVEYRDPTSGMSTLGFSLSMQLQATDVLYFRMDGPLGESNYDFHLYHDGEIRRRVLCHATWPFGDKAQEWWEGISDEAITRYEEETLYANVTEQTLLDNAKLEAILAGLGLSSQRLFGDEMSDQVLLSRRPGGAPLV